MDSPDRNHTISSSATQGSPFFNYLCSLSPIRPVKSVHVAQTFSELNFPPPPPVFTSPRVSSQKELSFLNRPPHKGMEYEENRIFSSSSCEKGKELMVPLSGCDMSASLISPVTGEVTSFETSASNQTKSKDKSMPTFFGCSPSRYVEQYLVDPVEEELYMVDSSELCSKPASPGLAEVPVVQSGSPEDTVTSQCSNRKGIEEISQSNSSEGFVDADKNSAEAEIPQGYDENPVVANSEETMKASDVRKIGQANIKSNEKMRSILSDLPPDHSHTFKCANHYISSHTDARHDKNSVDPTTSVFAFLLSKDSTCETDEWQKALSTDCLKISCQQVSENPVKGDDGDGRHSDLDNTPQPVQDAKSGADLDMKVDPESNCPMEHNTSLACKASDQQHRGMRRRCLDFEASEASKKNLGSSSWKPMSLISKTGALVNSHDLEKNAMPSMLCESAGTSDCKQLVISLKRETSADTRRCSQSSSSGRFSSCSYKASDFTSHKIECSVRKNGNSSVTVGMPSGIGLHLNSLATSMSSGCGVSMLTSAKGSVSMKGMGPLSGIREASSDGLGSCLLSVSSGRTLAIGSSADLVPGMVVSVMEKTRMGRQEHQSSEVAYTGVTKSTTCLRSVTVGIKPLHSRLPLKAEERNSSPLGKKRPPLQDISQQPAFGVGEEFNQSSPKKRRKSATIADKQGCKRCNCKKSKCLKLYCECFAAGVYCVEPCTCQECLNKPEHEDMVLGTRQQIESRNPLAFAPKIIRDGDSPPTNGDECSETPASARHKRGCNCKKSMCLKKYCECYQAGVGCSEGCRCEGCKNIYGKKEGSDEIEDKAAQFEEWDKESPEEKLGVLEVGNNSMHLEQRHAKDLSPITPSFQHACQGRSTVKVGPSGRRCFTSEDLESPPVSQSCAKPPRSPGRILRSTKGIQGNGTAIHSHKAGSKCSASLGFTPKTEKAGQFSPQWDGLRDICTVTPLPQPPLRPAAVDVSVVEGVEASPLHERQNEISGSSSGHLMSRHSCPGGAPSFFVQPAARSPVCTSDILSGQMPVNQTTPVTPALSTAVCNAENKLGVGSKSYIESHHISGCPEDDTPDILKDNGSPVSILKASSPNQKRVSPPHNYCLEKMTSRRPISSSGLRSDMEFIRPSVPQFPPLTPPLDEGQANINSRTE